MDIIDKKILCELDLNSRMPMSRLAKNTRVNRNVIAYRIKNMEKEGIIRRSICSINLGSLGYKTYKIYFKLQSSQQEKEFVAVLMEDKKVITCIKTEGTYDYSTSVAVKTILELDEFLFSLKNKFKALIKDYLVSIVVWSRVFKMQKLLLNKSEGANKFERYSGEGSLMEIDDKDKRILIALAQEANTPILEIAKKTGLSLDIVKYRLKQLQQKNLCSFRVMFDFNKLGYYHYVFMLKIRQATKQDEDRMIAWCTVRQNVMYITKRISPYEFEINAAITDINDFNSFLSELKLEFGEIIDSYDVIINSSLLKLNYVPF